MTSAPAPQPKSTKPKVLIAGLVTAVIAVLLCGGGAAMIYLQGKAIADAPVHQGSHTVQLEEGESTAIWSQRTIGCTVVGPEGPVRDSGSSSQSVDVAGTQWERVFAIDAESAGDYEITCSGPFVTGDSVSFAGLVPAAIGAGLGCISVVVVIIGLVLWLSKRRA